MEKYSAGEFEVHPEIPDPRTSFPLYNYGFRRFKLGRKGLGMLQC